jgi:hypothetical protein
MKNAWLKMKIQMQKKKNANKGSPINFLFTLRHGHATVDLKHGDTMLLDLRVHQIQCAANHKDKQE